MVNYPQTSSDPQSLTASYKKQPAFRDNRKSTSGSSSSPESQSQKASSWAYYPQRQTSLRGGQTNAMPRPRRLSESNRIYSKLARSGSTSGSSSSSESQSQTASSRAYYPQRQTSLRGDQTNAMSRRPSLSESEQTYSKLGRSFSSVGSRSRTGSFRSVGSRSDTESFKSLESRSATESYRSAGDRYSQYSRGSQSLYGSAGDQYSQYSRGSRSYVPMYPASVESNNGSAFAHVRQMPGITMREEYSSPSSHPAKRSHDEFDRRNSNSFESSFMFQGSDGTKYRGSWTTAGVCNRILYRSKRKALILYLFICRITVIRTIRRFQRPRISRTP